MTANAPEPLPPSVAELIKRINNDPVTRLRLVARFTDALVELGVRPEEVKLVSKLDVIEPAPDEAGGPVNALVFASQSDTRRNTRSIIIF
ncbi:hypothetical protein [Streptomyces sp. FH025]|uniref:hypothetical protein n=1 Tax=Streptomyces sp. FH025 TaxID=2815937 RepID=UPI001A9EF868|nr:hypothetical protein [Streptomyces sp. FH025]MBO1413028.1 hypothetical protein [Streptomyces sp. FH025]